MAKRVIWISLGTLLLLVVAVGLIAYVQFGQYLRSDSFRRLIGEKTSDSLKVNGEFQPLFWTGNSVYSDRFQAVSIPGGDIQTIDANSLRAVVNFRKIFEGVWRVDEIHIGNLNLTLDNLPQTKTQPAPSAPVPPAGLLSLLPQRFELGELNVDTAGITTPDLALLGSKLNLRPNGSAWIIHLTGGRFLARFSPELKLQQLHARITPEQLFLTEATATLASGGTVSATGEASFASRESDYQIEFEKADVKEFLPPEVTRYLTGLLGGSIRLHSKPGFREVSGKFALTEGLVEDLPVLKQLAKFTQSPQFNRLPVQLISGNYVYTTTGIQVTEFIAESAGLLRIEGDFTIGKDQQLAGNLQVGLTPQTLQWIPGSQEQVFMNPKNGYLWTSLKLGGTVSEPTEDLSTRLLVAMGQQTLQKGTELLQQSPSKAIDTVKDTINLLTPLVP